MKLLALSGLAALLLSSCSASVGQSPADAAAARDVVAMVDIPNIVDAGTSSDVATAPDRPDVPDVPPRLDAPPSDIVDVTAPVDVRRVDIADGLSPYTIDWMEWDDGNRYGPGGALQIASSSGRYGLSDGRTWRSGAGSARTHLLRYDGVTREGTSLRYALTITGALFDRTDYDSGDDSANCRLETAGPIEIVAAEGACLSSRSASAG